MNDLPITDCGCCLGIDTETPARIDNPPGLPAIRYRAGDYSQFRESLLARLSSSELPALARLTTRDDVDFTIALCEATATMMDVLTFYQERIANENYLRTATERGSVLELARLVGYTPLPGVAASSHLAFTLQESPGAPAQAAEPVTIPAGTRVQSVPGPGEQAQTFETIEPVESRVEWNAIPVQTAERRRPQSGDTDLWLEGVANQIQAGDVLLFVSGSDRWNIRLLTSVDLDRDNNRTRLEWSATLEDTLSTDATSQSGVKVYVFRQRASLFGHNAPEPLMMTTVTTATTKFEFVEGRSQTTTATEGGPKGLKGGNEVWHQFEIQNGEIDLDAAYPKIIPGSWFALVSNTKKQSNSGLQGDVELLCVKQVAFPSLNRFSLTGKATVLIPDADKNLTNFFDRRKTLVLAQSELLVTSPHPLFSPVYGEKVSLATLNPGLLSGRLLAVYGKRQRVVILPGAKPLDLKFSGEPNVALAAGDSLILTAAPELATGAAIAPDEFEKKLTAKHTELISLRVQHENGRIGQLIAPADRLRLERSNKKDLEVAEIVSIDEIISGDDPVTTFKLKKPLRYCYERASVRINANLAKATHGETVNEILGSGDTRLRNANYELKQSPLTYVSGNTPSGRQSTLEIRVNDLRWKEAPSLYGRGPHDRVYTTLTDAEAHTTIRFGDGDEGALPPSGDHNIRATYRKGLGFAGNVAAGKLTTLLTRPLGVSGVSNPEGAAGGADGENRDAARANAPLGVRTLDRAVSIQDYRDFARAFAGIAKAHALWIVFGPARGVFLSVAGEHGVRVSEDKDAFDKLLKALRDFGDPLAPLRVVDYRPVQFRLQASIKVIADADPAIVLPKVEAALREAFSFERREFGQGVSVDEVIGVAQSVGGVEAAYLSKLYRNDISPGGLTPRLPA
ncbi:MAG TPA: putative baseplate assembly protein, partial [Burkholderiales bacterium]|nr:putative baseplate assembly protein [Burkholderiales bacterium]